MTELEPDYRDIGPELDGFAPNIHGDRLTDRLGWWLEMRSLAFNRLEQLTDDILADIREVKCPNSTTR
jgi:hypothetical protein